MEKNKFEKFAEAGTIAAKVLKESIKFVKKGEKLINICEKSEKLIKKYGGKPAFPTNISINSVAAHYTSPPQDTKVIPNSAVVKIDVGAHIDGYIGDTATTVLIGNVPKIVKEAFKAAKEALHKAIEVAKEGVRVIEISEAIYSTIHSYGFGVLEDLNGHEIDRYKLHAGLTIPNIPKTFSLLKIGRGPKLKEGMVLAIEPFVVAANNDSSTIPSLEMTYIYSLKVALGVKDKIYRKVYTRFKNLPFALRWLVRSRAHVKAINRLLYKLEKNNLLNKYPTLIEKRGLPVVQVEHTILIKKSSAEILTIPT